MQPSCLVFIKTKSLVLRTTKILQSFSQAAMSHLYNIFIFVLLLLEGWVTKAWYPNKVISFLFPSPTINYFLLRWQIPIVSSVADIFSEISHKQNIRKDKISNTFWLTKPSSGLYWEHWKGTKILQQAWKLHLDNITIYPKIFFTRTLGKGNAWIYKLTVNLYINTFYNQSLFYLVLYVVYDWYERAYTQFFCAVVKKSGSLLEPMTELGLHRLQQTGSSTGHKTIWYVVISLHLVMHKNQCDGFVVTCMAKNST